MIDEREELKALFLKCSKWAIKAGVLTEWHYLLPVNQTDKVISEVNELIFELHKLKFTGVRRKPYAIDALGDIFISFNTLITAESTKAKHFDKYRYIDNDSIDVALVEHYGNLVSFTSSNAECPTVLSLDEVIFKAHSLIEMLLNLRIKLKEQSTVAYDDIIIAISQLFIFTNRLFDLCTTPLKTVQQSYNEIKDRVYCAEGKTYKAVE